MPNACRQAWTADEYFASSAVSNSDLKLIRESIRLYAGRKNGSIPDTDTAAKRRGRLLHLAVLEPHEFERRVVTAPTIDDDFRGTGAKARREKWKAELSTWRASQPADAIVVDADDRVLEQVRGMARALAESTTKAAKAARALLSGAGENEVSITWTDETAARSPIDCRARLDRLIVGQRSALVVDLKTTDDPSPDAFARTIASWGYHCQAAWYCQAARELLGTVGVRFAFVAVRSDPPHEVAVYDLEPEAIAIGHAENRRTLRELADAIADERWEAPWERGDDDKGFTRINLPVWKRI